jgi:hypothetical protein
VETLRGNGEYAESKRRVSGEYAEIKAGSVQDGDIMMPLAVG